MSPPQSCQVQLFVIEPAAMTVTALHDCFAVVAEQQHVCDCTCFPFGQR